MDTARFGRLARHLLALRDDDKDCHPTPDSNLCEHTSTSGNSTGITIGAIAGSIVVVVLAVLVFLHFRRKRMDEKEWPKNNQELDDYGFATGPGPTRQAQNNNYQPDRFQHPGGMEEGIGAAKPQRLSLDDLQRSLRGHTTSAFKRHDDDVPIDIKPAMPSDRI
ncbi:hypothetical protein GGR57DRAFT_508852 [Xylariaceae sp. FL1272]|nr:hypothetical protein GGR57DRAFT_508852 [Xylariaceae sp. FL1272]